MRRTITAFSGLVLTLSGLPAAAQTLGEECRPGEASFRPGISCQATDEFEYYEPYVLNAKKGDVLLSAGCGLIGGLLRQLPDRQLFSHSGMMVEDRVRIRHSTASEGRLSVDAGSDGFVADTIKFGWPGTITESIFSAYEGSYWTDPDDNTKAWFVSGFNRNPEQCEGDANVTFPGVVKPPFDMEDMTNQDTGLTVRDALRRAGDEAEQISGHYRVFAYSDADIVGRVSGPGARVGAPGTWAFSESKLDGTVCSQLAWNAARAAGLTLEDPTVETGDKAHGPSAQNGLYLYSEAERLAAGQWLYDRIYDLFYEETGWLGRLFTDAPDDGANQLVNCFGFDWCGTEEGFEWDGEPDPKDSERWRSPGLGLAVSPDDITHWDLPTAGGVYGLTEALRYRMGGYRPKHRWAPSPGTGGLHVTVRFNTAPQNGVPVMLDGFDPQTTSDALGAGTTVFVAVPAGNYWVEASDDVLTTTGPREARAGQTVNVPAGSTRNVVLDLVPDPVPPSNTTEAHRRVSVNGWVAVRDDDDWPNGDDTNTCTISGEVVLDPVTRVQQTFPFNCCADEARSEGQIVVRLNPGDLSVSVVVEQGLWERSGCGNSDHDGSSSATGLALRDGGTTLSTTVTNGEWNSDDEATVQVHVSNQRNTVP